MIKHFVKIFSIEIKKSLLYEHNSSKEHRDIENFFIKKSMTYYEVCNKEIRNDVWRENLISEKRLETELKNYCKVCKTKYGVSECLGNFRNKCSSAEHNHKLTDTHKENQERFDYCYSWIFYILILQSNKLIILLLIRLLNQKI